MLLVSFLVFCFSTGGLCQEWVNDYDGYLYFECPEGQSITRMMSIHSNHDEDRMWAFECSALEHGYESCAWSGYVNNYDEVRKIEKCPMIVIEYIMYKVLLFECASGAGVVSGMESEHDNGHEDRM